MLDPALEPELEQAVGALEQGIREMIQGVRASRDENWVILKVVGDRVKSDVSGCRLCRKSQVVGDSMKCMDVYRGDDKTCEGGLGVVWIVPWARVSVRDGCRWGIEERYLGRRSLGLIWTGGRDCNDQLLVL